MTHEYKSVRIPLEHAEAIHRVLMLAGNCVKREPADTLTTDGTGLLTWGELLRHIDAATKLVSEVLP